MFGDASQGSRRHYHRRTIKEDLCAKASDGKKEGKIVMHQTYFSSTLVVLSSKRCRNEAFAIFVFLHWPMTFQWCFSVKELQKPWQKSLLLLLDTTKVVKRILSVTDLVHDNCKSLLLIAAEPFSPSAS